MKQHIVATGALVASLLVGQVRGGGPEAEARSIVIDYIDQQGRIMDALRSTKAESDLPKLKEAVAEIAKKQVELASRLTELGPFDDPTTRTLWGLRATREYEVIGDASMGSLLGNTPAALQPQVMAAFQGHLRQFQSAEESIGKSLDRKRPGTQLEKVRVGLEGEFVATIGTAHAADPIRDPVTGLVFAIFAEQGDGSSVVLYEQLIPWKGEVPEKDALKSWIGYSQEKREVTFKYPSGSFIHPLPKKP